jgi:twitching motility protein PilT
MVSTSYCGDFRPIKNGNNAGQKHFLARTIAGVDTSDLDRLLVMLADLDGSDLHIKAGAPPRMRLAGSLRTMDDEPSFTTDETMAIAEAIMPPSICETFRSLHEVDFAYSLNGTGRFRVNAYLQRGSVALAMRRVRSSAATVGELGLPEVVTRLAEEMRGLVLVTGPTGSGKTTTLAAMVDHINHTRACHVVTIEDPVEYLHTDHLADIDQREVGFDTDTFASAMRVVLRQDPDVILVGEMRDQETVSAALTAAETGHLVFSTLHTINATETINRIVDFFPPHQQTQVRVGLAGSLKGIICQRLIPTADGKGRVPALELLVVNGRIQQAIIDPLQTGDIEGIVADGEYYGMLTFDQSLVKLLTDGTIDLEEAMNTATNPHDLKVMLERAGIMQTGSFTASFA